jgi:hypothetical protein
MDSNIRKIQKLCAECRLWDHTRAAVQDYIRPLEARVAALEAAIQRLEGTV